MWASPGEEQTGLTVWDSDGSSLAMWASPGEERAGLTMWARDDSGAHLQIVV